MCDPWPTTSPNTGVKLRTTSSTHASAKCSKQKLLQCTLMASPTRRPTTSACVLVYYPMSTATRPSRTRDVTLAKVSTCTTSAGRSLPSVSPSRPFLCSLATAIVQMASTRLLSARFPAVVRSKFSTMPSLRPCSRKLSMRALSLFLSLSKCAQSECPS